MATDRQVEQASRYASVGVLDKSMRCQIVEVGGEEVARLEGEEEMNDLGGGRQ